MHDHILLVNKICMATRMHIVRYVAISYEIILHNYSKDTSIAKLTLKFVKMCISG